MFGNKLNPQGDQLFVGESIRKEFDRRRDMAADYIGVLRYDDIVATPAQELVERYLERYKIVVPTIRREGIEQQSDEVWSFGRRLGAPSLRGTSIEIPPTRHKFAVPFDGDAALFRFHPSRYFELGVPVNEFPSAKVGSGVLEFVQEYRDSSESAVRERLERDLEIVERTLELMRPEAEEFNLSLRGLVLDYVDLRRRNILSSKEIIKALGFPLREREDASQAFVVPPARRRVGSADSVALKRNDVPEPFLRDDDYNFILKSLSNMAEVLERSPSAFAAMDEEQIRFLFLVPLNGQFESVAGEVFNFQGKSDICVRDRGKNVFIAECKIWHGGEGFLRAIDQVLGYVSWRDTKAAILLFNRNRNFSAVLERIPGLVGQHGCFVRDLGRASETDFRFVLRRPDDPGREVFLAVLAFDIPGGA